MRIRMFLLRLVCAVVHEAGHPLTTANKKPARSRLAVVGRSCRRALNRREREPVEFFRLAFGFSNLT
jgi:hypothetical protein